VPGEDGRNARAVATEIVAKLSSTTRSFAAPSRPRRNPMPAYDVDAVRRAFPSLALEVGGRPAAFLDGPAGTQVPQAVIDAIARLVPGVVGDDQSVEADSFTRGLLDYPHYTRPAECEGRRVPDVLLSGHHAEIRRWRRETALRRTVERRPELLAAADLDADERKWLNGPEGQQARQANRPTGRQE